MGRIISPTIFITSCVVWVSVLGVGHWAIGSSSLDGLLALLAGVLQEFVWLWGESGWSEESRGVPRVTRVALGSTKRLAPALAGTGFALLTGLISTDALPTLLPILGFAVLAAPVLLGMRSYGRTIPYVICAIAGLLALSVVWEFSTTHTASLPERAVFRLGLSRSLAGAAFFIAQLSLLGFRRARSPRG